AVQLPFVAFDGEGGAVAGGGGEAAEGPAGGVVGGPARGEEEGGFPGTQRHVELVEREGEPLSLRLDEGLFAGPTGEEPIVALLFREGLEGGDLGGREEAFRQARPVGEGTDLLHVDPHLPLAGEGVEGQLARVRDVEPQAGAGGFGERRLAVAAVG